MILRKSEARGGLYSLRLFSDAAASVYPQATWRGRQLRALFIARSIAQWRTAAEWYRLLAGPLATAARVNASLYTKVIRPYLHPQTSPTETLRILKSHYHYVLHQFRPDDFTAICSRDGRRMLHLATSDGLAFDLRWLSDDKYRKEGEHSLVLTTTDGTPLAALTFVLVWSTDGHLHLMIGGLQGTPHGTGKDLTRAATKALDGLRPKSLVLIAAQRIASHWGVAAIRATSNATHISRHRAYTLNRARRPSLAYDDFWRESGGMLDDDGYFTVPLTATRRSDDEIKPNKRAQYHRRYAMLRRVEEELADTLDEMRLD